MTNLLGGRVAIVTGAGRHRGIGTAICRALAEKDAEERGAAEDEVIGFEATATFACIEMVPVIIQHPAVEITCNCRKRKA